MLRIIGIFISLILLMDIAIACTTAVITGKATIDGRPLLWKNRETGESFNEVVYCDDGKYCYLGITNTGDEAGMEIWAGLNSEGFAIMNSASYNVETNNQRKDGEGRLMKLALQCCRTVEDFENILKKTNSGGRDVAANFGVIDRFGGAAFFETGANVYYKYDANDPQVAPEGFLIRTNYSFSGEKDKGQGYIRYERAYKLIKNACEEKKLDHEFIFRSVSRDLANETICSFPLESPLKYPRHYIDTSDTINRYHTASVAIFHGVKSDEDPGLATMWCILGEPVCGVALPLWVKTGASPQEMNSDKGAPINLLSKQLKKWCYPFSFGDYKKYLDVRCLFKEKDKGLMPSILSFEKTVFEQTKEKLEGWRKTPPEKNTMQEFEFSLAKECLTFLTQEVNAISTDKKETK